MYVITISVARTEESTSKVVVAQVHREDEPQGIQPSSSTVGEGRVFSRQYIDLLYVWQDMIWF